MRIFIRMLLFSAFILSIASAPSFADETLNDSLLDKQDSAILLADAENDDYLDEAEDSGEDKELAKISDPLEPVNRVFFHFNDKLYFWVLKPVAKGYSKVVPEPARISVRNFFNNLTTPVRLVNNILQFKFNSAGTEIKRFGINTTVGVLGLFDPAKKNLDLKMQDEDLGQTFGVWWNAGPGFYIVWPILGPSSLRDTVGLAGDTFLDPVTYVTPFAYDGLAIRSGDKVNRVSLVIGDYEEIKKDAIDPYSAIKDIYHQYRESKIDK
ncbi:MAG: VacJ family lipoprotein [Thermodesulfovibrionia bacterium]|nr:VacJ family lipoprotein [Thermodesulfovibrionia bacterium]